MPRMTRAALRNAALDDVEDAAEIPLPSTPQRVERVPLGEINLNPEEEPKILLEFDLSKPAKKASKSKKTKGAKRKSEGGENKENTPEVIDDDYQSTESSAVEEACEVLLRRSPTSRC